MYALDSRLFSTNFVKSQHISREIVGLKKSKKSIGKVLVTMYSTDIQMGVAD